MSATCEVEYKNQKFIVEVSKDGSLKFLDYDIEYDLALCEFGEDLPSCELLFDWDDVPLEIITLYMDLDDLFIARIAADWAEHVVWVFERRPEYQYMVSPRIAIDEIRAAADYYETQIGREGFAYFCSFIHEREIPIRSAEGKSVLRKLQRSNGKAILAARKAHKNKDKAADHAALAAASACTNSGWRAGMHAARAMGYLATEALLRTSDEENDDKSPEWKEANKIETAWQIRRFVDCLEAAQAGRSWPDLEDTK